MKRKTPTSLYPFHLRDHWLMPLKWFEKDKARIPKDQIVCDYGLTRNYIMSRSGVVQEIFLEPAEPAEQIRNWTWERHEKEVQAFWDSDRKLTTNLFVRAATYKNAVDCLIGKAETLLEMLVRIAENDDAKTNTYALHHLIWNFNKYIGRINQLAKSKPKLVQPIGRKFFKWPLLKSTHPHLSESNDLLTLLELGKETGIQIDRFSKWKPDKAMDIAFRLKSYQANIRENYLNQYPVKAQKIFQALPFNQENAPKLWDFAEMSLLHSYPKPETVKEFVEIGIRKSKLKNPSSRREAILEKIRARFIHLGLPKLR